MFLLSFLFIEGGYIYDYGPFPVYAFNPGVWYWVDHAYTVIAISCSIIILVRMWLTEAPAFLRQAGIVLAGSIGA